jgi:PD-(D/E)XK nuclease superfamily
MNHHGDTETRSELLHEELTENVIGAAVEVHRTIGPGLLAENFLILDVKCLERGLRVHEAQILTYLKMTRKRVGLILNFNVPILTRGGIVRKVL